MNPAQQPGPVQIAPMGLPFLAPQAPQPAYGQNFYVMIEQAQQLQNQAQQRQTMMMQEMMKAEEGYYDGPPLESGVAKGKSPSSGGGNYDYNPPEYQGKNQADNDYDSYNTGTKQRSGGKKFKTMEIDEYGNVSWE